MGGVCTVSRVRGSLLGTQEGQGGANSAATRSLSAPGTWPGIPAGGGSCLLPGMALLLVMGSQPHGCHGHHGQCKALTLMVTINLSLSLLPALCLRSRLPSLAQAASQCRSHFSVGSGDACRSLSSVAGVWRVPWVSPLVCLVGRRPGPVGSWCSPEWGLW